MRLEFFLFIFALVLAYLTGNISYSIKSDSDLDLKDIKEIQKLHIELQEEMTPHIRLDLNSMYPTINHLALLSQSPSLQTNRSFQLDSSSCLKSKVEQLSSSYLNKETLWLAYLCNQVISLPPNYFETPPFIHPSGITYAFMRYKMLGGAKERLKWLEAGARYMHIDELRSIEWTVNADQRFMTHLDQQSIKKIINGEKVFSNENFYFIATGNLKYYILEIHKAKRFFNRARFNLSNDLKNCSFTLGNTCWNKKPHNLRSFVSQSSYIVFIFTIIILFLTARGLFNRFKLRRFEDEKKKHALRVLTHELRTPIASLLLQIDQLNNSLSTMPHDVVEEIIKIEGQIYRLKHLAEKSQSYLQTSGKEIINIKNEKIDSIKDFILDIKDEYENLDIQVEIQSDYGLNTDPYWLRMIITNIVENAKRYGKPPVYLKTMETSTAYEIIIEDQGQIKFKNIKELLKKKHKKSIGLGLGLLIVSKTIKEIGGDISLTNNPTRFKLEFKKDKS